MPRDVIKDMARPGASLMVVDGFGDSLESDWSVVRTRCPLLQDLKQLRQFEIGEPIRMFVSVIRCVEIRPSR